MLRRSIRTMCAKPARISTGSSVDPVPSPVEAPHLLEGLSEPKPFLQPKALKAFSLSLLVGAAFAGSVYVLLSKQIADQYQEERAILANIQNRRSRKEHADSEGKALSDAATDHFLVQPLSKLSSYSELRLAAQAGNTLTPSSTATGSREVPMLHQEVVFRTKKGWNDCISNVQLSLEAFAVEYKRRREAVAERHVRQLVERRGLDVASLRRIDV